MRSTVQFGLGPELRKKVYLIFKNELFFGKYGWGYSSSQFRAKRETITDENS